MGSNPPCMYITWSKCMCLFISLTPWRNWVWGARRWLSLTESSPNYVLACCRSILTPTKQEWQEEDGLQDSWLHSLPSRVSLKKLLNFSEAHFLISDIKIGVAISSKLRGLNELFLNHKAKRSLTFTVRCPSPPKALLCLSSKIQSPWGSLPSTPPIGSLLLQAPTT